MKINIDDSISNQDNSIMWVSPLLRTKFGKLFFFIAFIPTFVTLFLLDWEYLYSNNKIMFLLECSLTLFCFVYVVVSYIISKIDISKKEMEYSKMDIKYYRNILNETSVGILSYIHNKRINYKDVIVGTLLVFEKRKFIKIDYKKKNVVLLLDVVDDLVMYEEYFFKLLKDNSKDNIISFSDLSKIILNENFKINIIGMIKKSSKDKKYFRSKTYASNNIIVRIILINFFVFFVYMYYDSLFAVFCLLNIFVLLFLVFIGNRKIYVKTQKGIALSEKLIGLKNYLEDFSSINEKEVNNIVLWDYYIIYAIIFDLKGNLDEDVEKLFDLFSNISK